MVDVYHLSRRIGMTKENVKVFNAKMASVLMTMPREKATKSLPACLTAIDIADSIGTRPGYTLDWLAGLVNLGLVQKLGKKEDPTTQSRWQLTANGRKVVGTLAASV
jgi:DNA-binding MarR family transcriptional regulator